MSFSAGGSKVVPGVGLEPFVNEEITRAPHFSLKLDEKIARK